MNHHDKKEFAHNLIKDVRFSALVEELKAELRADIMNSEPHQADLREEAYRANKALEAIYSRLEKWERGDPFKNRGQHRGND